ncbi:putative Twinfilin protein [Clavispora lusitaniae]|uniref:ADF-H domain-containing protein n=3 Tax=Clavispora lusitaniae TaxID=36911 RepID=C4Y080_CLAL4|nr:uncharacterized protein CLUG_01612 [Clavispora lusitaniae ATCC 42720]KAF5212145.1 Twinfilin-1 [Clavispora lusitaniae]EEQ37489.1 hypothetical protein CLUG_01612 [Clavispora lusitaniae ATCC 42720]KAF7583549.1 Cofilin/tropomyosin-type actin-binding family protein [Clavispora lusitaniae]OVF07355.1 putative twinfilin-1 [Clavispora lusitaniae]QFZ26492.1 putative Twinfilin protein [Clavispora lusitaniae]
MSTQSGIVASKKLLERFSSLSGETLLVTISEDQTQLVEDESYEQPSSGDLSSIFSGLHQHFHKKYPQPGYAIFPRPEASDFVFIAFIPDSAPIRDKMLYASTKNTLIQQIGSGFFGKKYNLALTELEELTPEHFAHATLTETDPSLFTEDERVLQSINSLQTLSVSQNPNSAFKKELPSMQGHSGNALFFEVDSKLDSVLRGNLENHLVVMNIDSSEHLVLANVTENVSVESLVHSAQQAVTESTPSYIIFGYTHSKVSFIYSCPSGSKVRDRMVYAANKKGLLAHLTSDYFKEGQLDKILEVGDLDEIDISVFASPEASDSKTTKSNLKFSKPKGPRRR